jgi:single-strand binding protein
VVLTAYADKDKEYLLAILAATLYCTHLCWQRKNNFNNNLKHCNMKQIENNFAVSGFVGKDAEIRQFANASVARFSLAVSRQEKNGEEAKRVSAFINVEAWRNNANTESLTQITKGVLLTVEGYFKPEEWTDKDGVKHNRIVMVANKFYPTPDKTEAPAEPEKKTQKGKK